MKPMSSSQQSSFKQVALIGRYHTPGVASNLAQLSAFLRQRGCGVLLERETARNCGMPEADALDYVQIGAQADLAVVLGGDGSMLNAARHLACYGVPLVGVNVKTQVLDDPFALPKAVVGAEKVPPLFG